ncbi:hypothetical protein OIU84_029377 [Salix udensis]|uniref:Bulb-type lectin domain-containing protein n=1 Tax=Salix udensis TaxID=889485 RepID=A0AAD6KAQ5_9ROSI|nr:hypothetical protein OIU84_029377 [Salix udensis]
MASAYSTLLLVFFFWITETVNSQQSQTPSIELGSSLSTNFQPTSWHSPSGRFAFGFYQQDRGFIVGIWLASKPNATITWTINRKNPHVSSNATLELTKKGELVLRRHINNAADEEELIAKDLKGSASYAQMLDSGNFVLCNERSEAIWESFNFPTDTILGGQNLNAGSELLSSASAIDLTTRFHLKMQVDGNLVLYPADSLDLPPDAYWSSDTDSYPGIHLNLTWTGDLLLVNKTLHTIKHVSFSGSESNSTSIIYRATLGSDGVFRLYSHNFSGAAEYSISLMWYEPEEQCDVKGSCGLNSYCNTIIDSQPDCLCLPGTAYVDPNRRFQGCERNYKDGSCKDTNEMAISLYNIVVMEQITWDDDAYNKSSMTEEGCRESCLEDCNCAGALYELGSCNKKKYPVKYARRTTRYQSSKAFFKSIKSSNHSSAIGMVPPVIQRTSKKAVVQILVMSLAFITWCLVALSISGFFILKSRVVKGRMQMESGNFGMARELTLRAFSYRVGKLWKQ